MLRTCEITHILIEITDIFSVYRCYAEITERTSQIPCRVGKEPAPVVEEHRPFVMTDTAVTGNGQSLDADMIQ